MKLRKLVLLIAPLGALIFTGSACQTAHRPANLIPAQAAPPALTSTSASTPSTQPVASEEKKEEKQEVKAEPQSEPELDPVAELIAKVEKEYQAGQANYQAGRLEQAKKNFDNAFNLLSTGPVEIRSDVRLQREFDKILEGVNGLPLTAVQESDGLAEQKSEPAPIDEANEVNFPVDPNLKAKAEAEVKATHSDLPLMLNDTVASYINYFSTRGRDVLERALERSGQYHDMIRRVLKEQGLPQDLIYLAQAESGFRPLALSRAGARGMWQFMSSRARGYGLTRNWWIDERQDPEKSTKAAARHLKDLYNEFGDWYLAMAAYNSGPGTVQSAVKRTGYADFWELYRRNVLPRETRNYVPIILAVTIMAKNPAQYGLDQVVPAKPVPTDNVKLDYSVDLRLVAQCVDATPSELQDLNPSLLRKTTPKDQPFELRLPAGSKEKYLRAIAAIPPDMRVWWRYHTVQPGDTLASIARSYRTTAKAIASTNQLNGSALEADTKLIIPIAPGKHGVMEDAATYARRATTYKVRKGDTVASVADVFGVPPAMVRRWNRLKGNSLRGRRVVYVHLPVSPNSPAAMAATSSRHQKKSSTAKTQVVRHTVKQGETLTSIASSYKTTVSALQRYNGKLAALRPGMILIIRDIH
jgi:membrane-bound lytic murein transglycosylase D